MTSPETVKPNSSGNLILSAEDWLKADFTADDSQVLIGTQKNPLVRSLTKNLIQAPEKAFKTTFLLRLALGISTGETVFSSLPVKSPRPVLYLHGELSPAELKERLQEAAVGLRRPLDNFFQGRSLNASLVTPEGRTAICELWNQYKPGVLVLDPWQSFIAGADENSFKDVSPATTFLDWLIAKSQVTVFLAIHEGKVHKRGARGHSALAGWRDTLFKLKKSKDSLTVEVEPRWAKAPAPLKLTFCDGTLWEGDAPGWTLQAEEIRKLLQANEGRLTRKQVALGLGIKSDSIRMALKRAHNSGAICVDGDIVTLPPSLLASPNHTL
jgi:hypothetical protein